MCKKLAIYILLFILLLPFGCKESEWFHKIEKFDEEEIESFNIKSHESIVYRNDIIAYKKPFIEHPEIAFKALLNTKMFEDCCGPEHKLTAIYYHVLMLQPDPEKIFLDLLKRANKAGKLYALIALQEINYSLFTKKIVPFLNDSTRINTFLADVESSERMDKLLVSDWSQKNLIKDKSVKEWLIQNPLPKRKPIYDMRGERVDVINGGFKYNLDSIESYVINNQE